MRKIRRHGPGRVAAFDRHLLRAVARQPAGPHDAFFSGLSAAATRGKLWIGIAAVMALVPGRPRRAAAHGLLALGTASALVNLLFKTVLPRARPLPEDLPVFRFVHPQPTSSSLPSGHSASAAAFALGVCTVSPVLGAAFVPVAAAVAYSRVHTGAHWPSDVLFGSAIGAGAALLTRHWWPERQPAPPVRRTPAAAPALAEGAGLSIVVNTLGGSYSTETVALLQENFPHAHIHEIREGDDVEAAFREAAARPGTRALGVWGGDGTAATAAAAALERSLPLLVLPGGTLNHFARDVGVDTLIDAAAATSAGSAISTDVGMLCVQRGPESAGETIALSMLNTASIGVYPNLVRRRERLQGTLGKPLAGLVAALRTFAADSPTTLKIDGVPRKVWILYLGRGRYYPRDLAPLARPVLDNGVLDIRMVDASGSFGRLRVLWAALTGTVAASKAMHLSEAARIKIEAIGAPLVLAVDGEPLTGVRSAEFTVQRGKLRVYSPSAGGRS